MSRKSVFWTTGIGLVIVAGTLLVLGILLRHEPAFYRRSAVAPGMARKKHSDDFLKQVSALVSDMSDVREWSAQLTCEQINSFFEEDFRKPGVEDDILPADINDPRVDIETDRLRLGFRYGKGLWSTIVTIDLRVWVAKNEPNVVGLELQGMHAGALPINAQSLLEHVSEAARRKNIEVNWYRHEGNPVAILRFQNRRSRATVQLQQLELHPGKLMIQGRSLDSIPPRGAPGE